MKTKFIGFGVWRWGLCSECKTVLVDTVRGIGVWIWTALVLW